MKNKILFALSITLFFFYFTGCSSKSNPYIIINNTTYSRDEIRTYAEFFGYDARISEAKFIEFALLKEASVNVIPKEKDSEKIYYKTITNMLYAKMKKDAQLYFSNVLPDTYFSKIFIVDYDFVMVKDEFVKREHEKTILPGELPAPIDYYLAQALPGDRFSDIETKFGYFSVTVKTINSSSSKIDDNKIISIKNAISMALMLKKIKEKHSYQFHPEVVQEKRSEKIVIQFDSECFSVADIEKNTLLPTDPTYRYQSIRYFGEMKLLEKHYKEDITLFKKYCDIIAKIKIYQDTYFKTHMPDAELKLGKSVEELTLTDGILTEKATVLPGMENLLTVNIGNIITYNGKSMTVVSRKNIKTTKDILEEYLLRELFKELQKRYTVRRVGQ